MSSTRQHLSLREWLTQAPFGLTLSSGFFGFFAHCGVITALNENSIKPAELSGSSAGALVGGFWSSGLTPAEMQERLFTLDKADFWDPGFGIGLLRGRKFRELLSELLPTRTFKDNKIPLSVSATELLRRRTQVLDQGDLVPAIYASCCVPLMFQPIRINNRLMVDGGVTDRPGLAGMKSERVLYHHLASRSPWRGKRGAHTVIPKRNNMQTLIVDHLPRVGPNQLYAGKDAFHTAREATLIALDQSVNSSIIRI